MMIFMSRLAMILTQEDRQWNNSTYWLLDYASMHKSAEVSEHLVKLGVKVILSRQYVFPLLPSSCSSLTTSEDSRTHYCWEHLNVSHLSVLCLY